MDTEKKHLVRRFFVWLIINPLTRTIATVLPMIWFGILFGFYGIQNGYIDPIDGTVTQHGINTTTIVYSVLSLITFLINTYSWVKNKKAEESTKIAHDVLERGNDLFDEILRIHKNRFENFVLKGEPAGFFSRNVEEQMDHINEALQECISKNYKINSDNVSATLIYNFDRDGDTWYGCGANYQKVFKDASDIATNPGSFGYYMLEKCPFNFYLLNNKRQGDPGRKSHDRRPVYTMNGLDKSFCINGSITGYKFVVKAKNLTAIRAVIFVSTFGKKLDRSFLRINHKEVKRDLIETVFPTFVSELKSELMCLYEKKYSTNYPDTGSGI